MNIKLYNLFIMLYKFLKKIIGAIGYKIVDKNLIKNERLISDYTNLTVKKTLENLFELKYINSVIQVGSNDGKRFDSLNTFIKKYTPKTIFVEPIKSNFNDLKKNYSDDKNLTFENLAISVNDEINQLYKVKDDKIHLYDDHIFGITSFDKNHLLKHGVKENHIEKETVETISIEGLLNKHSIKNFDLLLIDTEGYDGHIVSDFLQKSKIKPFIFFEYIHIKNDVLKSTLKLLKENDFILFKIEENIFCCPKDKKIEMKFSN